MSIFKVTEKLRRHLEIARTQHNHAKEAAQAPKLPTIDYVTLGKKAEYHRGMADGIRLSIETITRDLKEDAEQENHKRDR